MNGMFPPHSKDVTPNLQNRCASSSIYTRRERDQFLDRFFLPRRINFQHPVNLMPRSPPHRRGHALHSRPSGRALPGLLHVQSGRAPPRPCFPAPLSASSAVPRTGVVFSATNSAAPEAGISSAGTAIGGTPAIPKIEFSSARFSARSRATSLSIALVYFVATSRPHISRNFIRAPSRSPSPQE